MSNIFNIDLHLHSFYSDGELSPNRLVERAHEAGITTLSLTDHDTTAGCRQAHDTANKLGIKFINGIELSTRWRTHDIHIVGLNIDIDHPDMVSGCARQAQCRQQRVLDISERLQACGLDNCLERVQALAGKGMITRAHFAQLCVDAGMAKDFKSAFTRYLGRGKPAYVASQWASVAEAVEWITAAGGVAVIAHPGRYKLTTTKLKRLLDEFKGHGGHAIEVVTSVHSAQEVIIMTNLAREFELHASVGSDFHRDGWVHAKLGRLAPLPAACKPVWQLWTT